VLLFTNFTTSAFCNGDTRPLRQLLLCDLTYSISQPDISDITRRLTLHMMANSKNTSAQSFSRANVRLFPSAISDNASGTYQ